MDSPTHEDVIRPRRLKNEAVVHFALRLEIAYVRNSGSNNHHDSEDLNRPLYASLPSFTASLQRMGKNFVLIDTTII